MFLDSLSEMQRIAAKSGGSCGDLVQKQTPEAPAAC
jgi:hypothetical protein